MTNNSGETGSADDSMTKPENMFMNTLYLYVIYLFYAAFSPQSGSR
jgi:hypothetical protein